MNFCHACQRHLNGALACAGCGTSAEYLTAAPPGAAPPPGRAMPPVPEAPTALADVYADSLVTLSVPNERRAGARRRAERRRRSRMTLTVTLGVLLATAASLLVVRMAENGKASDRASEVVLTDDGPQQPAPLPDLPTSGAPSAPGGKATAKVAAGPTKKAAPVSLTPGTSASASAAPAPTLSGTVSGTPSPSKSGKPGGQVKPSQSASGTATPSPTGAPTPTPKPTKTKCNQWWNPLCW
ncbi:hypothetical protein ACFXD5_06400 [Streptomyces sp. NPDC059385]|uniref:SCO2400 family protein n=1 Tax=Streptomyces sp. NPDC059385 TaxID=3346817 RepID=UPI0036AF6197